MINTINLVDPDDKLSAQYEISKFPDGQQSFKLIESGYSFDLLKTVPDGVTIKSRLNTFRDLELIICAAQALKRLKVTDIKLYIPYCLGGRSDRQFSKGGVNYIKHVIAPVINQQKFSEVTVMDPHSNVLEACIDNFEKIDNMNIVNFAIGDYMSKNKLENASNIRLISPDAGAMAKIFDVAEKLGYEEEIITATKHRNGKGEITHTSVPMRVNDADKDIFIIDDICDGGRTFIEIAKVINDLRGLSSSVHPDQYGKNYLIVTHGIFSAGFSQLNNYFETIYTTNSVADHNNPKLKQINVF